DILFFFFFSSRRRHTRSLRDWSSDVCSSDLAVINAKEFGGVFALDDAGTEWRQVSAGLGGRDVFSLQQTRAGILVAGTQDGLFRSEERRVGKECRSRWGR